MADIRNGALVTVGAAATQILAAPTQVAAPAPTGQLETRRAVIIRNVHATENVHVGASGVATTTGYLLKIGETLTLEGAQCPQNALFAIRAAAADSTVFVTVIV